MNINNAADKDKVTKKDKKERIIDSNKAHEIKDLLDKDHID